MNTAITISFSIHYKTYYGQELLLNLDDTTVRKLTWTSGDIWMGSITIIRPRNIRWWYSVTYNDSIQRVEEMQLPRTYPLDSQHNHFHIFDRWGNPCSSVSPLTIREKSAFTAKRGSHMAFYKKEVEKKIEEEREIESVINNVNVKPQKSPYIHVNSFFARVTSPTRIQSMC